MPSQPKARDESDSSAEEATAEAREADLLMQIDQLYQRSPPPREGNCR